MWLHTLTFDENYKSFKWKTMVITVFFMAVERINSMHLTL